MKFLDKLKLLFVVQKPAGEIMDAVADAKKTKKWIHFVATVLGIAISATAAWSGYMSPTAATIVTSALNAIYNIVRGADKADNTEVKGTFTTTELWLSVLNEAQNFVVAAHTGGVQAPWLENFAALVNFGSLALGQNLSARSLGDPSSVVVQTNTPQK